MENVFFFCWDFGFKSLTKEKTFYHGRYDFFGPHLKAALTVAEPITPLDTPNVCTPLLIATALLSPTLMSNSV